MHHNKAGLKKELGLSDWKRLVDEAASHQASSILLRGGEPFLFPGIIELLEYINGKGIFISIDTNGTVLRDYAADILRIGRMHLTVSVDGPEEIHDKVRGFKGCFKKIKENIALLNELEKKSPNKIGKSITFTISPYSYKGLGSMPDIARSLGIGSICIVPYYYVPEKIGRLYEKELMDNFSCRAFSWRGFHHEDSGIDFDIFREEYGKYLAGLKEIKNFPYLPLTEDEYKTWFDNPLTPVKSIPCSNVEKLIDIQPDGSANFCVDFPDYSFGNIKESTIEELWNSERAELFREHRRKAPFSVCWRCGAKYMSEIKG